MKKKLVIGVTSLVLVAALAIGGTMALMTAKTDTKTNVFTVGAGLSGELKEPLYNTTIDNFTTPNAVTIPTSHIPGEVMAQKFTAGTVIDKDPAVANLTPADTTPGKTDEQKSSTVWVAIKLAYSGAANTFAKIDDFATIDFNTTNWEAKDATNTVFYYKTTLAAAAKTATLFNHVTIDNDAVSVGTAKVMHGFTITATAYMVQAANVTYDQAKTALDTAMA
nr:SipW-dependent-type signal peptide-containing protein [uncultured Caproiciproducens sp.]